MQRNNFSKVKKKKKKKKKGDWLKGFNDMSTRLMLILCPEVRESHSFYVYIFYGVVS